MENVNNKEQEKMVELFNIFKDKYLKRLDETGEDNLDGGVTIYSTMCKIINSEKGKEDMTLNKLKTILNFQLTQMETMYEGYKKIDIDTEDTARSLEAIKDSRVLLV